MTTHIDPPARERDTHGKPAICAVAGGVVVEATRAHTPANAPAGTPARTSLLAWITDFFRRDTDEAHPIDRATD